MYRGKHVCDDDRDCGFAIFDDNIERDWDNEDDESIFDENEPDEEATDH